ELIRPIAALPYSSLLMDGELVILDEQGRPSFQRLQNRARIGRAPEIRHASVETPGTLYLFDLIAVEGFDLRSLPLVKRKALLRKCCRRRDRCATLSTSRRTARHCTTGRWGWDSRASSRRRPTLRTRAAAPTSGRRSAPTRPGISSSWATPRPRAAVAGSGRSTWGATPTGGSSTPVARAADSPARC